MVRGKYRETFDDLDLGNGFLTRTPIARDIIAKTGRLDGVQLESCCQSEETFYRMREKSASYSCINLENIKDPKSKPPKANNNQINKQAN